ncbi:MAG: hypothetical protein LPK25_01875 [Cyclobacteriaceae bacterium]|nr:hypothetical protein [Cyclobacteriaceae bacterium]MDX5465542.1 hypothetical protein [Cyclobacteriaceae bacterium]
MRQLVSIFSGVLLLFSCSGSEQKVLSSSNEWELVFEDSVQVNILGKVYTGEFRDGIGLLFEYTSNTLYKINESGQVLGKTTFPESGPNSINAVNLVKIGPKGQIFISSYLGKILELNSDLSLKREIEMPFKSLAFDGLMNSKTMEFWEDELVLLYPGRNEVSPYLPFYYRDHFLLEKLNLSTGESVPIVRTPPTSRFSGNKLYERPSVTFAQNGNSLFLYFSNEPKIHVFDRGNEFEFKETIDLEIDRFVIGPELKDEFEYYNFKKLIEGHLTGIFLNENLIVSYYSKGIAEDEYASHQFEFPKDFGKLDYLNPSFFKVFEKNKGWSNEIKIPEKVEIIFSMYDPEKPFFGMRNDEWLGEEQDYITFYKLKLVKK